MECCTPFAHRDYAERHHPDDEKRMALKRYFGFKKDLVLRAECLFYYELVKRVLP